MTRTYPAGPVPESPVPESPVPESPVPESPVPESPVPKSLVPEGPVPESPALTGLRGVAAVLVVLHHASLRFSSADLPGVGGLLRKGYLGVDLFFVLSGFVMCMVYGGWFAGGRLGRAPRAGSVAVFLVRRAARLWPLHAAVMAAVLACQALGGGVLPSWRFVLANAALVQGWGLSGEVNAPAWSASTELLAYLLFPLLAGPVLRWRWGAALALAAVALLLAACLGWTPDGPGRRGLLDVHQNYSPLPAMRCLAGFLLGMLAWRAGQVPAVRHLARRPWAGPGALALALGLMAAWASDLLVLALLPVVVLGMHHGRGRACRVLASQPLHGLGTLSYAVYLIHFAVLSAVPERPGAVLTVLALYVAVVLMLAALAHQMIESPTRRLMRWAGEAMLAQAARPALARLLRHAAVRRAQ